MPHATQSPYFLKSRNVANIVVPTAIDMLSVVQYAVEVLNIKHIIVCGHYNCGGVKSAMTTRSVGPINLWLQPLRDLYAMNREEIDSVADEQGRWDRLVEINIRAQVCTLAKIVIIRRAWQRQGGPEIHGWVYNLRTGFLNELVSMAAEAKADNVYTFEEQRELGA